MVRKYRVYYVVISIETVEEMNRYLEKLIQVPFRIPALGEVESCIYIMLLMVGSVLPDENENYKKLREEGLSRIKKPWNVKSFTVDDVKEILGSDYEKCSNEILIATQICHLLANNTDGNPRKIKRFINMLLLRYEISKNRGFGDELELAVLAKMMLAEYLEMMEQYIRKYQLVKCKVKIQREWEFSYDLFNTR